MVSELVTITYRADEMTNTSHIFATRCGVSSEKLIEIQMNIYTKRIFDLDGLNICIVVFDFI